MRARIRLHLHLTRARVRLNNRLRAVLLRYYPAALQVFAKLSAPITLNFILTYPTPLSAASLSYEAFEAFVRQHQHACHRKLPALYAKLQSSYLNASPETVTIFQEEATILAALLLNTVQARKNNQRTLRELVSQHPDHHNLRFPTWDR
jgi:hypothetical protein